MSDRGPNIQAENAANAEPFDLAQLRASKDAHSTLQETATDLSQASIPTNHVHRIPPKQEARLKLGTHPGSSYSKLHARGLKLANHAHATRPSSKPNGIFRNPYYRYSGGILARLITFFANVLKTIEQLILRMARPTIRIQKINPPLRPDANHNPNVARDTKLSGNPKRRSKLIQRS
jgi:hypothetical protein